MGRVAVDKFETAVERNGKGAGYIVAFSFTKDAHEEVARVKRAKKQDIRLVTVARLLEEVPDLAPGPGELFPDLPLPPARTPAARPSIEELVASEKAKTGGKAISG